MPFSKHLVFLTFRNRQLFSLRLLHAAAHRPRPKVAITRVDRLNAASVHRRRPAGEKSDVAAQDDKLATHRLDLFAIVTAEVGNRLKFGASLPVSHMHSERDI